MKYFFIVLGSIFLTACVTQPIPQSSLSEEWKRYGEHQALRGLVMQSEHHLNRSGARELMSEELYSAYQAGYNKGKTEYCQQDARSLGRMLKPYYGICDDVDPFFRKDYNSGRGRI